MAGLTKDELKTALVTHGVEFSLGGLKKDELVALYGEYVAPHDLGEFSSDDEAAISPSVTKKVSRTSNKSNKSNGEIAAPVMEKLTEENSLIVGEIKVDELTDEKLAKLLKDFGIDVGPIVDSTRSLYQKKLAIVMREQGNDNVDGNDTQNGHDVNGKSSEDTNGSQKESLNVALGEYSADEEVNTEEEDEDQPAVVVKKSTRVSVTPKKTSSTKKPTTSPIQALGQSIRQRFSAAGAQEQREERFTPTPRRSIHSYKVTESSKTTITKNKDGSVTQEITQSKVTEDSNAKLGGNRLQILFKVLPGVFLLLILAALVYYVGLRKK